ncbi:MAG: UDP-N-acetylmuramoyl-L-alanyl-D-glutamate--2,6-diaminopimelate ligase [Candidatus Eremiobacteraeota bacterium]|nr:UDP-N-acetylmuramoyl-L-alanyl-D-glutamate--2,6-diaminopimelate ligase [Candidatus Eremiobacteraeota bacterium]
MENEPTIALGSLLSHLPDATTSADPGQAITGIETNSQVVRPGALFVALRGEHTDGHRYAAEALAKGAGAVVVEAAARATLPAEAAVVSVLDTRRALSRIAAAFYRDPSHALTVIGITGTNGKTTVSRMIAAILNAAKMPCGVIGTVGAQFGSNERALSNTTPLPPELHSLLARMRDGGATAVAMEVSSHALALGRVEDVAFSVAVLTNVTRDHLDFHETIDAYAAAKRRLFELAPVCVLNVGDPFGERWATELKGEVKEVIAYGERAGSPYAASDIVVTPEGSSFTVTAEEPPTRYELRLIGRFNVENALAAIAVARRLGVAAPTIAGALSALEPIPGRMERLFEDGVAVVIDYAHTPSALEHALSALRETAPARLAVVFGCGGDRDRGKRAEMGAVAARLADNVYLTNDNPRTEDAREIVTAIASGIAPKAYVAELDRRRAIERAITEAGPGDVVLVAGKGHERYQIVGKDALPFDDLAVAREALRARSTHA